MTAEPIHIDDRRLSALIESGPPDIGILWEICLHFEFDRTGTVDGIASWLGPANGMKILDCACGSGFPSLDLIGRGYNVTCSDGSELMLDHFRRNAKVLGVGVEPSQARWEELRRHFSTRFDVVMCRGGSFPYAGTWDKDVPPNRDSLSQALDQFVACLADGGRLYIDTTQSDELPPHGWARHPDLVVGSHLVQLEERVDADPEQGIRIWHSRLVLDGVSYDFERRSHYLPHKHMTELLTNAGLQWVRRDTVPGEHYDVFVGTRAQ
ncbi:MAG: class I SAM-dependent methyltransferase [Actinomycetota bacterium]